MLAPAFLIFLTGLLQICKTAQPQEEHKRLAREAKALTHDNGSASSFWNESAVFLSSEEGGSLCKDSTSETFPGTSCDEYLRCHNGMMERYRCVQKYLFEGVKRRCMPQEEVVCSNVTEAQDPCCHEGDGLYPEHSSNCRQYYSCANGQTVDKASCPAGQSLSYHRQKCLPESSVTCVKSHCKLGHDGFFILPGSTCQAYYLCSKGVRSQFVCPQGHVFSLKSKVCVPSGICYEPVCAGRINGHYPDTTHNCSRSFYCRGGHIREVSNCPAGLRHNGRACVAPALAHCDKPEKTAVAFFVASTDECSTREDGRHVVPETDCRRYFRCSQGRTVSTSECPRGQRFDGSHCAESTGCLEGCVGKQDGRNIEEHLGCQEYYTVQGGELVQRKMCADEKVSSGNSGVAASLAPCNKVENTDKCLGLADGFHPDYFNRCRSYFYCVNYQLVLTGSCNSGMAWNGQQCVQEGNVICHDFQERKECRGLAPGLYQDNNSACVNYFYCSNGKGTLLSCPAGKVYDGETCVSKDEYTCSSTEPSVCHNQEDGYRQGENCRSYYYCSNGHKITYVCSDNFIFNGTTCVARERYTCPYVSDDCQGKHNGYHADQSAGCRMYYYCFEGDKITSIRCGGRKVFDGHRCVLTGDPVATCAQAGNNPCLLRPDGRYVESSSGCTKFFTCENKVRTKQQVCPKGTRFDGSACVLEYVCPTEDSSPCADAESGFHQDLGSNCTKYYFCIGGRKTVMSCQGGQVFNGQVCVEESSYQCPSRTVR